MTTKCTYLDKQWFLDVSAILCVVEKTDLVKVGAVTKVGKTKNFKAAGNTLNIVKLSVGNEVFAMDPEQVITSCRSKLTFVHKELINFSKPFTHSNLCGQHTTHMHSNLKHTQFIHQKKMIFF